MLPTADVLQSLHQVFAAAQQPGEELYMTQRVFAEKALKTDHTYRVAPRVLCVEPSCISWFFAATGLRLSARFGGSAKWCLPEACR